MPYSLNSEIPSWAQVVGSIAGALGLRELLAAWQKQKFDSQDDKDKLIKELRLKNDRLEAEVTSLQTQVQALYSAVRAMTPFVDDERVRDALKSLLDEE